MSETTYTFYPDSNLTFVVPPPECDVNAGVKPVTPLDLLDETIQHIDSETPFTVSDVSTQFVDDIEQIETFRAQGNALVHLGRAVVRLGWKEPVGITFANENLQLRAWHELQYWLDQQPHLLNSVVNTARLSIGSKEAIEPYLKTPAVRVDYVLDDKEKPSTAFVQYANIHELTAYVAGTARNNEASELDGKYHVHRYGFTPIYLPVKTYHQEEVRIELPHPSLAA